MLHCQPKDAASKDTCRVRTVCRLPETGHKSVHELLGCRLGPSMIAKHRNPLGNPLGNPLDNLLGRSNEWPRKGGFIGLAMIIIFIVYPFRF